MCKIFKINTLLIIVLLECLAIDVQGMTNHDALVRALHHLPKNSGVALLFKRAELEHKESLYVSQHVNPGDPTSTPAEFGLNTEFSNDQDAREVVRHIKTLLSPELLKEWRSVFSDRSMKDGTKYKVWLSAPAMRYIREKQEEMHQAETLKAFSKYHNVVSPTAIHCIPSSGEKTEQYRVEFQSPGESRDYRMKLLDFFATEFPQESKFNVEDLNKNHIFLEDNALILSSTILQKLSSKNPKHSESVVATKATHGSAPLVAASLAGSAARPSGYQSVYLRDHAHELGVITPAQKSIIDSLLTRARMEPVIIEERYALRDHPESGLREITLKFESRAELKQFLYQNGNETLLEGMEHGQARDKRYYYVHLTPAMLENIRAKEAAKASVAAPTVVAGSFLGGEYRSAYLRSNYMNFKKLNELSLYLDMIDALLTRAQVEPVVIEERLVDRDKPESGLSKITLKFDSLQKLNKFLEQKGNKTLLEGMEHGQALDERYYYVHLTRAHLNKIRWVLGFVP